MKHLRQKTHHYTLSPHAEPTMTVTPGETVIVETLDNVGNRVDSEMDKDKIRPPLNPLSGPIYIEGAERGDALEIIIENIKPTRDFGWTGQTSEWGFIEMGSPIWNIFKDTIPTEIKICRIQGDKVTFPLKNGNTIDLPLRPIVGTIGTAPEAEVQSTTPGPYGGNMDCQEVRPKNRLYLPVYVEGGLLYLGDIHALQGHGELGGAPIEIPSETTLTINLVKEKTIGWPRIVSEDHLVTVGSSKPTEAAIKTALAEMVGWLMSDYSMDIWDANLLLTATAEIECSQITNPLYTAALKMPKSFLPK
ncbi:MAG: acetamidase/formamidase family protein [Candidatus Bathyarchaeia archaeon]